MNTIWQVVKRCEYWVDFARTFLPFWVAFTVMLSASALTSRENPTWLWSYYWGVTALVLIIALYSAWYQGVTRK